MVRSSLMTENIPKRRVWLPLAVFLLSALSMFQFRSSCQLATSEQPVASKVEQPSICDLYGLHGPMKPNATATMISTSKVPSSNSSTDDYRIPNVWYSWQRLKQVNFVVLSNNCEVLKMAQNANLPTLRVSSGNELKDLTVFHMFETAVKYSTTPIVGYVNGDIAFDESLPETLLGITQQRELDAEAKSDFFIVGRRLNVDVPDHYLRFPLRNESQWLALNDHCRRENKLFQASAMDYFIFNRGINIKWDKLPPLFIGGVRFDMWIAEYVLKRPDIQFIEATTTLRAFHFNHDRDRKASQLSLASMLNEPIRKQNPLGVSGTGRTWQAKWETQYATDSSIKLVPR